MWNDQMNIMKDTYQKIVADFFNVKVIVKKLVSKLSIVSMNIFKQEEINHYKIFIMPLLVKITISDNFLN